MQQAEKTGRSRSMKGSKVDRTLVLVENRSDAVDYLRTDPVGTKSMFITFDWMTLNYLKRDEHLVFPHEEFIPRDVGMKYQSVLEELAQSWYMSGENDLSESGGISLAAPYYLELMQYFAYMFRYAVSFARAINDFEPDSVTAYLVPANYPYLEHALKREVITQAAQNCGLSLTIRDSSGPQELRRLPESINTNSYKLSTGQKLFFGLVSHLWKYFSLLRKKKPEILIYPEGIFHTPLFERYLERCGDLGYRFVFPVTSRPPRPIMLKLIWKGSLPFYPRGSNAKRLIWKKVRKIRQDLENLMDTQVWKERWAIEGVDFSALFSKIIRDVVLNDLEPMAIFVSGCERAFEKMPVKSIVVPNDRARVTRVLMEVARSKGIKRIYFEHGLAKNLPVSLTNGKKDLISSVICWGEKDRAVFKARRIVSKKLLSFTPPFLADYVPPLSKPGGEIKKVLLLEHCYTKDHVNGITYAGEEFLLKLCRGLTDIGVEEIRFKVHPGRTIKAYFQRLLEESDLKAEVFKNEELRRLILWSDLVIGPVSTAVLETFLLGRDYYCVDLEGLEWQDIMGLYGTICRIFPTVEAVLSAVKKREGTVPKEEDIRSICGITKEMTRDEILDPILDYFQMHNIHTRSDLNRMTA